MDWWIYVTWGVIFTIAVVVAILVQRRDNKIEEGQLVEERKWAQEQYVEPDVEDVWQSWNG